MFSSSTSPSTSPALVADDAAMSFIRRHAPVTPVRGAEHLCAHQTRDLFATWQTYEEMIGRGPSDPPFWAVVWPAAVAVAQWLHADPEPVRGRRVLELGCGGGIAGIAAARAGAREVLANDRDAMALLAASANAAANGVRVHLDHQDRVRSANFADADVVLIADLFYERSVSERLLEGLRAGRARVFVADAGRPFAPPEGREVFAATLSVDREVEGVDARAVRIREWAR